jgi:TPR repeat protein
MRAAACIAALLWATGFQAGTVLAQAGAFAPTPAVPLERESPDATLEQEPPEASLEHEPPALRALLQRAGALESAALVKDYTWQAAVLYCQAARLGSTEGQYRLGMLYAFGQGVPESRSLAASLFSMAASQGHAQAGQMLETIQLTSYELPACIEDQAQLPEKAPAPASDGALASGGIDQFLNALPAHKRWVIPLTTTLSEWYELDPRLVLSVIAVESNFETGAQSPKAAMGLMQLIPDTAQRFNVRNAYNATQNLRGGMRYLRWLLSYYRGDIVYALAAYNAGEKRVDRFKGVPPFPETRAYVRRVIDLYGSVRHVFDESLTAASPWLAAKAK